MEEFLSDTTFHGVEFFESKGKNVCKGGFLVFFLAFCGLGFYIYEIHVKYQVDPIISEEVNSIPAYDFPFPAVTICSPLFARDQKPNLYEVLKNPNKKLSIEDQKYLAANVQACAPHLASKFSKVCKDVNASDTAKVMREKFHHINDSFAVCSFALNHTSCDRLFNYVLTDHGFCFSYNLQGFNQIFRPEIISEDFISYRRKKIAKIYTKANAFFQSYETVNDDQDEVQWTLEKGYSNDSYEIQPTRALQLNRLTIYPIFNKSDLNNLCPEQGKSFSIFLHMPNEILTPFHVPQFINIDSINNIPFKVATFHVDEDLRRYSPFKRGCYFENEKPLKFFKSYTKSLCEFECLTNRTLEECGCVKFSMPRNNSTPICGLNEISCYMTVWKKWSRTSTSCKCLQSCTNIVYKVEYTTKGNKFSNPSSVRYTSSNSSLYARCNIKIENSLAVETKKISLYSKYNVFSDFGSIFGIFFGCSVLTMLEIFYFLTISIFKVKSKIEENFLGDSSNFASESTIHGVQFFFDSNRKKVVRIFWLLAFLMSLSACLFNAKGNYTKMMIEPEIEEILNQKPSQEIPFPAISICSTIFAKNRLANYTKSMRELNQMQKLNISNEELKLLIANTHSFASNMVQNIPLSANFSGDFNIIDYLDRSNFLIDELFFECKLGGTEINCPNIFKRVMSVESFRVSGFCYSFNQENFHKIFNDEISHDFDSYGRGQQDSSQWSLDKGYQTSDDKSIFPYQATAKNSLMLSLKISQSDASNIYNGYKKFSISFKKPNEITSRTRPYEVKFNSEKTFTFSAKTSTHDQDFRKFTPENRGCYFTHERKLKFFKSYTENNCLNECLANYTLDTCKCVKFNMVRNNSMRVCTSGYEAKCYDKTIRLFPSKTLGFPPCGCLKTCNDIQYSVKRETNRIFEESSGRKVLPNFLVSRIKFEFIDPFVIEEENLVGYGFKDFMTDFGGLLGLFLGCSMMSLMEIFYHPFNALWRKCRKNYLRLTIEKIKNRNFI